MKGMEKAVARIMQSRTSKERVIVYGDYDADGVTAAALLYLVLKHMDVNVACYLPHRLKEGYGLNPEAIRWLAQEGTGLIITVDCGISSAREVMLARSFNIDVIITDHHQPPPLLPQALSVINPKQPDCPYPFKELAGVGIAFLLAAALRAAMKKSGFGDDSDVLNLRNLLDLVALGTIADQVPLTDQNRILTYFGLEVLNQSNRIGIEALKEVCGLAGRSISSWNVAFQLVPRLNAGGRMSDSSLALKLLTTDNAQEAREVAVSLNRMNAERQHVEDRMVQEAEKQLNLAHFSLRNKTIVLASRNWHRGVMGIVASRILERYHRPTIIISLEDGISHGSGRSVQGLNLYSALDLCSSWLTSYGGHTYAAGITIDPQNIVPFSRQFEEVACQYLTAEYLTPLLRIDGITSLEQISMDDALQLRLLEPFGTGNPEPVWLGRGLAVQQVQKIGEKHLRLAFRLSGPQYTRAIGFDMSDAIQLLKASIDAAFTLYVDEWGGTSRLGMKLRDIRNAE
jgi:single-stranded-DNA-specific exonuclease